MIIIVALIVNYSQIIVKIAIFGLCKVLFFVLGIMSNL